MVLWNRDVFSLNTAEFEYIIILPIYRALKMLIYHIIYKNMYRLD